MKKLIKTMACAALAASLSVACLFGGCSAESGTDGRNGLNGQDVSIYDIYDAVKEETNNPDLTFSDFVKEYLSYSDSELAQATSLQTTINRSLLSGVSIITTFSVTTTTYSYTPFGTIPHSTTVQKSYAGSGMILSVDKTSGDMYVVTNCHVVYLNGGEGDGFCDDISLYLYGEEFLEQNKITAELICAVKTYDLAVLKVTGSDVVKSSSALAAEWCDDEEVYLGETVYAVGNPEGEKLSATQGIISKDTENITIDLEDTNDTSDDFSYRVLRTDAAINGGNSGGPLFNTDGKVVGIVNAKSISTQIDNMGYALPSSTSRRVVQNLLANYSGTETHGLTLAKTGFTTTIKSSTARYNNTKNVTEIIEEVMVNEVTSNTPFSSDIQYADVIKQIVVTSSSGEEKENVEITRSHNVDDVMLSVVEGDTVTIVVERSGVQYTFTHKYVSSDFTTKA